MLAWVHSWATPAQAFLGKGKKDSAKGAISNSIPSDYSWVKSHGADQTRFVDLDKLNKKGTAHMMAANLGMAFPIASDATIKNFEERVRSRAKRVDGTKKKPKPGS